jgi:hypothetical protein
VIYQSEPTTVQYHFDRASARTEAEREEHWRYWWTKYGEPYQAAVIEAGGTPWTADPNERRRVWFRRYERPDPPAGIPRMSLAEIRGDHKWTPAEPTQIKEKAA